MRSPGRGSLPRRLREELLPATQLASDLRSPESGQYAS
jgi:hypothetical protein